MQSPPHRLAEPLKSPNRTVVRVIGRAGRGAKVDFADWAIPVANEWTDRVYLANGDGQIMCLRPRDSRRPQFVRVNLPPRPSGPPVGPAPEKKMEMEKKDGEAMKKDA